MHVFTIHLDSPPVFFPLPSINIQEANLQCNNEGKFQIKVLLPSQMLIIHLEKKDTFGQPTKKSVQRFWSFPRFV